MTGSVGVEHLHGRGESSDNCPGQCCLTLLQLLPLGDVNHDHRNADHVAAHTDWIEVCEPAVDSIGIRGRRTRDLLVDGRLTAVDDMLVDGLEGRPQRWNDVGDPSADLVFDRATIDRSEHRVDAQESKVSVDVTESNRCRRLKRSMIDDASSVAIRLTEAFLEAVPISLYEDWIWQLLTPSRLRRSTRTDVADGAAPSTSICLGTIETLIGIAEESLTRWFSAIEGGETDAHRDPGFPVRDTSDNPFGQVARTC